MKFFIIIDFQVGEKFEEDDDDEEEENHLQPIFILKKLFLQFCVVVQVVFIHVILAKFGYIQNRKF